MAKKTIKMNEAQLRKLVKESINEIGFDKNRRFATTTVTDPVGYHYTFRDAAANIIQNGFSPKYLGKNGQILGPGIYFYTEPHVHDQYGDIEIKAKITGTYPATEWDGGTMFVVPIEDLDKIEIISAKQKYGYGPEHSVKDGKKEHEINQMYRQYGNRSVGGINGVDDADDYYDLNKNSGSLAMQAMEEPDDHVGSLYRDNGQDPRWASPKGDFTTKRISESQLRNMIAESVKKALYEYAEGNEMNVKDFGIEEQPTHYENCVHAIDRAMACLDSYMDKNGIKMDYRGFGMDDDIHSLAMSLSYAWNELEYIGDELKSKK